MRFALRQRLRDWPVSLAFITVIGSALALAGAWLAIAEPLLPSRIPFRNPEQLAAIESVKNGQVGGVTWRDLEDLPVESAAAFSPRTWGLQTEARGHVEVVLSQQVTGKFFTTLGTDPYLGEPLTTRHDQSGNQQAVWFTYNAWTSLLNSAPIGKLVWINAKPYRLAGVLPKSFDFPFRGDSADIYIPLNREDYFGARGPGGLQAIARLRQAGQFTASVDGVSYIARDLTETLLGDRLRLLRWLLAAIVTLVLVAMANASGIWLAQWLKQQRQASIQLVLGAPLRRVLLEQVTQAMLLGFGAALIATMGTITLLGILRASPLLGPELERMELWSKAGINATTVLYLIAAALTTSLASAALPLLTIRTRAQARTATSRFSGHTRLALAVAQLTLTGALAYTGILIWRNVQTLFAADRGFRTEQILTSGIGIPEAKYNTDERMIEFHQRAIKNLSRIPGVTAAASGFSLPLVNARTRFLLEGENVPRDQQKTTRYGAASPDLLKLLAIPLVKGRAFADTDRWGSPRVVLVNQAFADRYLGNNPLGRRIKLNFYNGFKMKPYEEHEVIGVIGNTLNRDLTLETEPQVVTSTNQIAFEGFFYFLRSTLPAASLNRAVRQAIWDIDPEIQSVSLKPLTERVEQSLLARRTMAWLAGLFGTLAALIVGFGLASSLSATFLEMTRELGIRAALGATPARLAHTAVRWAVLAVGLSWLLSFPITVAISKFAAVSKWDASSWLLTGVTLTLIGTASAYLPARRAATVNPAQTLRSE